MCMYIVKTLCNASIIIYFILFYYCYMGYGDGIKYCNVCAFARKTFALPREIFAFAHKSLCLPPRNIAFAHKTFMFSDGNNMR